MRRTMLFSGALLSLLGAMSSVGPGRARAQDQDQDTLLKIKQRQKAASEAVQKVADEWKYPGALVLRGGSSSHGDPRLVDRPDWEASYHAFMTTPDDYDDVVKFYEQKTKMTGIRIHKRRDQNGNVQKIEEPIGPGEGDFDFSRNSRDGTKSMIQEDSEGRGVKLRIFVQYRKSSSFTLVISRTEGEGQTHISWTYFEQSH